jgi:hypothetical protein
MILQSESDMGGGEGNTKGTEQEEVYDQECEKE